MKKGNLKKKQNKAGVFFVAPALFFLTVFLGYPVVIAFITSFTKYDMLNPPEWVGLSNYVNIFTSSNFYNSLWVTLQFAAGSIIPIIVLSLVLAVVLNNQFKGSDTIKLLIFLPVVLSEVVAAVIWKFLLHPYGVFNEGLLKIGIINTYISWLTDPDYVIVGFIIFALWKNVGYFMVIFLTGLQNIPKQYYEAAAIDGVSIWQRFFFITLPLLKPTVLFAGIVVLINIFNTFTPFYVMTRGGPVNSSEVLSLLIYRTGFQFLQMGKASALSVVLLLIVSIFSIMLFRLGREH
ncbi:carbohydrate ABC transporter permease [Candidatus Contubernalis alkaliaceticus]|uniref:carbohydrate ABC transporter permease n=1 Tax=Candidatus Contubernalis alkaliaceticus TaxID=338645 RepID=UPI001F4C210E|nr:sugar ABC transporter permease [Candidatus Contubernalis alkalaceticus]UNC90852.1 sugar ABC transporter permease [Candidatus Contubernalis alkalaceticus]